MNRENIVGSSKLQSGFARLVLLLGVFFLGSWGWEAIDPLPEPADVFFVISVLLTVSYAIGTPGGTLSTRRDFLRGQLLVLFFVLLATIAGASYGLSFSWRGLGYLARLLLALGLSNVIYHKTRSNPRLRLLVCTAFVAGASIYLPAVVWPSVAESFGLLSGGYRFRGLAPSPNTIAAVICIAAAITFVRCLDALFRSSWKRVWTLAAFVGFGMLLLWTQSRAYISALMVVMILSGAAMMRFHGFALRKLLLYVFALIALPLLTWTLLPSSIRERVTHRYFSAEYALDTEGDARALSTRYYLELFSANPAMLIFGLGVNYEPQHVLVLNEGEVHGPNTILDVPVFGGIGLFIPLAMLATIGARNVGRVIRGGPRCHPAGESVIACAAALGVLWIAGIFVGSPLFGYHSWILLTLVAVPTAGPGSPSVESPYP